MRSKEGENPFDKTNSCQTCSGFYRTLTNIFAETDLKTDAKYNSRSEDAFCRLGRERRSARFLIAEIKSARTGKRNHLKREGIGKIGGAFRKAHQKLKASVGVEIQNK